MNTLKTIWSWTKWTATTALPKTVKTVAVVYVLASIVYTTAVIDGSEDKVIFWQESQAVGQITKSKLGKADYTTWRNARAAYLRENRESFEDYITQHTRDAVDMKVASDFQARRDQVLGRATTTETTDEMPYAPQR